MQGQQTPPRHEASKPAVQTPSASAPAELRPLDVARGRPELVEGRRDKPADPAQGRPMAESTRQDVTVRVSVVQERHDEEEKEAGYGHGV